MNELPKFTMTDQKMHNSIHQLLIEIYAELQAQRTIFLQYVKDNGGDEKKYFDQFSRIFKKAQAHILADQMTKYGE